MDEGGGRGVEQVGVVDGEQQTARAQLFRGPPQRVDLVFRRGGQEVREGAERQLGRRLGGADRCQGEPLGVAEGLRGEPALADSGGPRDDDAARFDGLPDRGELRRTAGEGPRGPHGVERS